MRRRVGYRRIEFPLPPDLIQSGKHHVAADGQALIFFRGMLYTYDDHRRGKPRVLQNALADERGDLPRRGRFGETLPRKAPRFRKFSLLVPAAQLVEFVATD